MALSFRNRLKISCSDSSFREIRSKDGFYVDKTKHIYDCLGFGKYFFIARPRRFGKSLLCSTLQELFSGNRELFKGLWIDQSDWTWEQYPVVKIDMTALSARGSTREIVEKKLIFALEKIAKPHDILLPKDLGIGAMLGSLIEEIKKKYNKNVAVIIDEYDKPLLDVIDDSIAFDDILGLLKSFYETLKSLSGELSFVFVTGVFKFSKAGMFSGANNFTDLTFDISSSALIGYTQDELEANFGEGIDALCHELGKNRCEMLQDLQEKYNGYRFAHKAATPIVSSGVYNSYGINHVFVANDLVEKWFESGSPAVLMKKLHAEHCKALLHGNLTVTTEELTSSTSPATITSLAMLYYAGYLTIDSYDPIMKKLSLIFPNLEVSSAFSKQLINELMPERSSALTDIAVEVTKELRAQSLDRLQDLLNQAFANYGYSVLLSQEKNYQIALFTFFATGGLRTRIEDVTQDGRIDIVIEMRHCVYIIELKVDQTSADAITQIKTKDYARKYRHLNVPIWAIGVNLAGKKQGKKGKAKQTNEVLELVGERL